MDGQATLVVGRHRTAQGGRCGFGVQCGYTAVRSGYLALGAVAPLASGRGGSGASAYGVAPPGPKKSGWGSSRRPRHTCYGHLESTTADIRVSGSGRVNIRVDEQLTAEVRGSGHLLYVGEPAIRKETSGSGEVRNAGE